MGDVPVAMPNRNYIIIAGNSYPSKLLVKLHYVFIYILQVYICTLNPEKLIKTDMQCFSEKCAEFLSKRITHSKREVQVN